MTRRWLNWKDGRELCGVMPPWLKPGASWEHGGERPVRACRGCEQPLPWPGPGGRDGPPRRWCSTACYRRTLRELIQQGRAAGFSYLAAERMALREIKEARS